MYVIYVDRSADLTPQRIKEWRIEQGMTQQELASILGLSVATVARWEREDHITKPTGTAEIILQALILKDTMRCGKLYSMLKNIYK